MVLNSLSLSFLAQASELGYDLDNAIVSMLLLGPQTPQDTARPKYSFFFLTVFFVFSPRRMYFDIYLVKKVCAQCNKYSFLQICFENVSVYLGFILFNYWVGQKVFNFSMK